MRSDQQQLQRPNGAAALLFSGIWLFYLIDPVSVAWRARASGRGWVAIIAIALFCAVYLLVFARLRQVRWRPMSLARPRHGWVIVVVLLAFTGAAVWAIGQTGTALLVFLATVAMQVLPTAAAISTVAALVVGALASGWLLPGWTIDSGVLIGIVAAAVVMWGVGALFDRNRELLLAREENARLAVADERDRFARDLHDILGHSLTVIAMKAELAQRLVDADPERARSEVAAVERLARDSLADVRQAVSGYREASLPGEITRARQALSAAGIVAELPHSTDEVPSRLRELFAWSIREGVTNVVRHSGATHCRVLLSAESVEVLDDGRGPSTATAGFGLAGLRERAAAVGATVVTWGLDPGFGLKVVAGDG